MQAPVKIDASVEEANIFLSYALKNSYMRSHVGSDDGFGSFAIAPLVKCHNKLNSLKKNFP